MGDRDDHAIRSLVEAWMRATAAGDLPRVLELMDDDVVFLVAGRPPMRGKGDFAAASNAMRGRSPVHRSGPALSILRKKPDGHWVIFRDANMIGPAK
jgi:ketosteroid isomerase-like protein